MRLGGLEAGGTKMVCAVGDAEGRIFDRISIPTKTPEETLPELVAYFKEQHIDALGIGCFGPIDLKRTSPTYGHIMSTPKLSWRDCNIVGRFQDALSVPVGFDTDVNAACMGEAVWGIARDVDSCIYITIGTGIGVGVMVERKLLHGMLHPEAGHIILPRYEKDEYPGKCPYHKNCFEGLASGPALQERCGKAPDRLAREDEVWDLEAYYIANAVCNYILTLSPERIILGGGVMHQTHLLEKIRCRVIHLLNGYMDAAQKLLDMEHYLVTPSLKDNQGILGCFWLAMEEEKRG